MFVYRCRVVVKLSGVIVRRFSSVSRDVASDWHTESARGDRRPGWRAQGGTRRRPRGGLPASSCARSAPHCLSALSWFLNAWWS